MKDLQDNFTEMKLANSEFSRRFVSLQNEHEQQKLLILKQIRVPTEAGEKFLPFDWNFLRIFWPYK